MVKKKIAGFSFSVKYVVLLVFVFCFVFFFGNSLIFFPFHLSYFDQVSSPATSDLSVNPFSGFLILTKANYHVQVLSYKT